MGYVSIAETEAIEAVRAHVSAKGPLLWDEATLAVHSEEVEGRSAWVVEVADTDPNEGEPWMRTAWAPMRYFVDRVTGELFGYATERSRTLFTGSRASGS